MVRRTCVRFHPRLLFTLLIKSFKQRSLINHLLIWLLLMSKSSCTGPEYLAGHIGASPNIIKWSNHTQSWRNKQGTWILILHWRSLEQLVYCLPCLLSCQMATLLQSRLLGALSLFSLPSFQVLFLLLEVNYEKTAPLSLAATDISYDKNGHPYSLPRVA